MTVKVSNEQSEFSVDVERLEKLARFVLSLEGPDDDVELSVGLVDEERMAKLNETYTSYAGPTDVLAFPYDEAEEETPRGRDEPRLLGDVVLCPAVASRDAAAYESTLEEELSLLLVHGTLHLLGYDHADEWQALGMKRREKEILEAFGAGGDA